MVAAAVIAIVAIGAVEPAVIADLRPTLESQFGVTTVIAPPLPLPADAYDPARHQYRSTRLLDALASTRTRPQWERTLGIADVDLYVPGLNFVFGEANARRDVAVFSLARLRAGGAAAPEVARRARTEAVHELGHTYGLRHCDDPHCAMWFSNTLAETDAKGAAFCAAHAAEVQRTFRRLRAAPSGRR